MKSSKPSTNTPQEGSNPDLLDSVFDNVCPVPDVKRSENHGAVEEKTGTPETKKFTMFGKKDKTSESGDNNENDVNVEATTNNEADAVAVTDMNAEASALEKLAAKFDMNCCAKNSGKQADDADAPVPLEDEKDKAEDRSLTDFAAKMNDIDLESQNTENDDSFDSGVTKQQVAPFYKEPFYATLIALCGAFTIAIIVMSVLVAKK